MTDGDAIRRVVAGDVEAFSILVGRYHAACMRCARRLTGSPETAEEAVQDAFVRAFRGLRDYDDRDQFKAWLFRILVNRCRTAAARERRRTATVSVMERIPEPAETSGPGVEPARLRRLDAALARLTGEQREAFLLKYVEEWSYEEIARITGDSISALKMRVMRAREELRRILAEDPAA